MIIDCEASTFLQNFQALSLNIHFVLFVPFVADLLLWLIRVEGQNSHSGFIDTVTFDHSIECAAIDAEDLGGAGGIAARDSEDVGQGTSFEFVERRQIFEES